MGREELLAFGRQAQRLNARGTFRRSAFSGSDWGERRQQACASRAPSSSSYDRFASASPASSRDPSPPTLANPGSSTNQASPLWLSRKCGCRGRAVRRHTQGECREGRPRLRNQPLTLEPVRRCRDRKTPKPADLSVLGLRPQNDLTPTPFLSTGRHDLPVRALRLSALVSHVRLKATARLGFRSNRRISPDGRAGVGVRAWAFCPVWQRVGQAGEIRARLPMRND